MESFDCSLCWPGDFNFSAEPHWQRGRFRSCTLTTVCFVSWIAAFHRELHQLLDLMDLTLTQGLRLSQRKILKRFDSVCNLIRGACLGNPVDFHWRRNSSRIKGPKYYWDLGSFFFFYSFFFFFTWCIFLRKCKNVVNAIIETQGSF